MATPRQYFRPQTLEQALELAAQPDSLALAGGAVALGTLDVPFETLVDLQAVPELRRIEHYADGWHVGAACSLQQVIELPGLPDVLRRSLARAVPLNIRCGASVGESLLHPDRFPEWIAALVAHDIAVHQQPNSGETALFSITEALLQPAARDLRQGIITGITIPALELHEALGAAAVARTPADDPIVCAAAFVRLDGDARRVETVSLAVGGASAAAVTQPQIPLQDQPLDEASISHAVEQMTGLQPVGDYRGSVEYRAQMARVLVQRALIECLAQLS